MDSTEPPFTQDSTTNSQVLCVSSVRRVMLDHTRPARGPVQPAVAHTNCEWVLYPNLDLAQTDFFWAQTIQN